MDLNGLLLSLVGVMNLILILLRPVDIQGREPYLYNVIEKNVKIGFYSYICRPISFKLGLMIETTKLYIFISVWMV